MNFLEAVQTVGVPLSQQKCKYAAWLDTIAESDKAAIENHIADLRNGISQVNANWLYKVSKIMGAEISLSRFYCHIQGECKCPK